MESANQWTPQGRADVRQRSISSRASTPILLAVWNPGLLKDEK